MLKLRTALLVVVSVLAIAGCQTSQPHVSTYQKVVCSKQNECVVVSGQVQGEIQDIEVISTKNGAKVVIRHTEPASPWQMHPSNPFWWIVTSGIF